MTWFLKFPGRLIAERKAIDALADEGWLRDIKWKKTRDDILEVRGNVHVHGREYAFQMAYPRTFPNTPISVRPQNSDELWTGHQYGAGGSLCLHWRADNWHTKVTGAAMLEDMRELFEAEADPTAPSPVPSDHLSPRSLDLRLNTLRCVITPAAHEFINSLGANKVTQVEATRYLHIQSNVILLSGISAESGEIIPLPDIPEGVRSIQSLFSLTSNCTLVKSPLIDLLPNTISADLLKETLKLFGISEDKSFVPNDAGAFERKVFFLCGAFPEKIRVVQVGGPISTPAIREAYIPSNSIGNRLPATASVLTDRKVGIVGAGSFGSKIAVSLARSGIRNFVVVDDELLAIGNMVRHELDWRLLGEDKVHALKEALSLTAAGIAVLPFVYSVARQESSRVAAAAMDALGTCDVIVDATANADVFLCLAALCLDNRIPMVWGELFAGGCGAQIARARPEWDPNPLAVRNAIVAYMSTLAPAPHKEAGGYEGTVGTPLVAHDSDVGFVAMTMARMVIDILSEGGESIYPHSAYLLGLRNEWIFTQPFDIQPIAISGPGWNFEVDVEQLRQDTEAVQSFVAQIASDV